MNIINVFKTIIKKLFFINFFINKVEAKIKKRRIHVLSKIPIFKIQKKNISNLRTKLNRIEILKDLNKNCVCAELGVAYGEFSDQILKILEPKLLVLIDSYPNDGNFVDEGSLDHLQKKFSNHVNNKQVKIINRDSISSVSIFEKNYFDWIYIDTTHEYNQTLKELRAWKDRIKKDGFIFGHDYVMGNWEDGIKYGVKEAVHQFCVEENRELVYLTAQIGENTTFGIRKINF